MTQGGVCWALGTSARRTAAQKRSNLVTCLPQQQQATNFQKACRSGKLTEIYKTSAPNGFRLRPLKHTEAKQQKTAKIGKVSRQPLGFSQFHSESF
jgi:hypothetical protein